MSAFILIGIPPIGEDLCVDDSNCDLVFVGSRKTQRGIKALRDRIAAKFELAHKEYNERLDAFGDAWEDKSDEVYDDICKRYEIELYLARLAILRVA